MDGLDFRSPSEGQGNRDSLFRNNGDGTFDGRHGGGVRGCGECAVGVERGVRGRGRRRPAGHLRGERGGGRLPHVRLGGSPGALQPAVPQPGGDEVRGDRRVGGGAGASRSRCGTTRVDADHVRGPGDGGAFRGVRSRRGRTGSAIAWGSRPARRTRRCSSTTTTTGTRTCGSRTTATGCTCTATTASGGDGCGSRRWQSRWGSTRWARGWGSRWGTWTATRTWTCSPRTSAIIRC